MSRGHYRSIPSRAATSSSTLDSWPSWLPTVSLYHRPACVWRSDGDVSRTATDPPESVTPRCGAWRPGATQMPRKTPKQGPAALHFLRRPPIDTNPSPVFTLARATLPHCRAPLPLQSISQNFSPPFFAFFLISPHRRGFIGYS